MELDPERVCERSGNKCKIEIIGKHLQLQLMISVNSVADSVFFLSHLRGDYEMQRVVEL